MDAAMDRPRLLAGLLSRLGEYSVRTFRDRLVLQKTVYLLQAFGIYLGYPFNWYLRGPYSPQLAKDAYSLEMPWSRYTPVRFANKVSEDRLGQYLVFVAPHKSDAVWLETAASAHFLAKVQGERNKAAIFETIAKKQPYVTQEGFESCWSQLESERLI